jgi:hypothetical protein
MKLVETNIKQFIKYISKFNNIIEILDNIHIYSNKGFVYERLWDIIFKFNFHNNFKNYDNLTGNLNNGIYEKFNMYDKYLNLKIISGNSSGISDISLKHKEKDKFIFISVKYFNEEKTIDNYDIDKIIGMIDGNKEIYTDYKIILCVKNKIDLINNLKKSTKKYYTKYIKEKNIFDINDLNIYFLNFIKDIKNNNFNYDIYNIKKENLILRFHQNIIIHKIIDLINNNQKKILIGAKPRCGKTYICGGLIDKLNKQNKINNILVITPVPNETMTQFTDDLFKKYKEFEDFNVIILNGLNKNIEFNNKNIIVTSKQFLQKYIKINSLINIKNLNLDLIIFDENHFGGSTRLAKNILESYNSSNTINIFLTATYFKSIQNYNISEENRIYWDLYHEELCKSKNIKKLTEIFGDYIKNYIDNDLSKTFNIYDYFPKLHILTNQFELNKFDLIKQNIKDPSNKYGFSFDALFSLINNKFKYYESVKTFISYISGSCRENTNTSIIERINNINKFNNQRKLKTQIWFLPPININIISENLKEILNKDLIFKNYEVMCINSKINENELNEYNINLKQIKNEINKYEKIVEKTNKEGLIILVGQMLNLGITLKNCDVVMLFNNSISSDKIFQQMFRSMTEGNNKKYGYVVDLNINRTLYTCITYNNYTKNKNLSNIEEKIKNIIEYKLIVFDTDYFINKEIDSNILIENMLNAWKENPVNNILTLLSSIEDQCLELDTNTQKLINNYFSGSCKNNIRCKIEFEELDDEKQEIQNGKDIIKDKIDKKEKSIIELQVDFNKAVLPFIIPLSCILTIKNNNKNLCDMLDTIKKDNNLLNIFNEQSVIWWNNKNVNLFETIEYISKLYVENNEDINNVSLNIKLELQKLIDYPDKLINIINECLKPKDIEKIKHGEVFTPLWLIDEILDKIDEIYKIDNNNKSIFKNKYLKWYDPCVGMGNFMVCLYNKLIKYHSKNWIIENMIYMSEINSKNCFIVKQIFGDNCNLYNGDSLNIDIKNEFKVNKFDVIIGNPPYNSPNTKSTGNTIYQKFIKKYIELINLYLSFINPSSWRKPNTEKCKNYGLFKLLTNTNTLKYLEIHNTKDGMKTFKCGTRYDWYIIENKKNNNYKTIIKDEIGNINNICCNNWNFLPNYMFNEIEKILCFDNENLKIMYSRNNYGSDKKYVNNQKDDTFKYPVIHKFNKNELVKYYSSRNDLGMFGIKKIIFCKSGISNIYNDKNGKYGLTEYSIGIEYDNKKESEKIINALSNNTFKNNTFKNILKACSWSVFGLEWRIFTYFKKDFYNYIE